MCVCLCVFICVIVCVCACLYVCSVCVSVSYQADELGEGHPHSDLDFLLPLFSWPDLQVVVLEDLLVKQPL